MSFHQRGPGALLSFTRRIETMRDRAESKTREADQEIRQKGSWTGIGFAIVLFAAVIFILLLILG